MDNAKTKTARKWHLPNTDFGDWHRTRCGRKAEGLNVVGEADYAAAIDSSILADGREVCAKCRTAYDFG